MAFLLVILSAFFCLSCKSATLNKGKIPDDPLLDMFRKQEVLLQKVEKQMKDSTSELDRKITMQAKNMKHAFAVTMKLQCPREFFSNEFGCYKFIYENLSYDDATSRCREYGSHLLEVQSKGEYEALISLMDQHGATKRRFYHLGGKKVNNVWIWIESKQQFTFTNWSGPGQDMKGCGRFVYFPSSSLHKKWTENNCKFRAYSVCEI